ncbi:MAG: glycosyltransferase [Sulfuricaulis sp.]|uniref:glycosyltransferase n=1 Tax=Sulfuricaulis sp. TaxID=2003553 RepID=UPI0034A494CE
MEKILIHALGAAMGGAMRHITNFLPELGRCDANREYVVQVRESFPALDVAENIRFERVPDHACSSWPKRIAGDVFKLPQRLRREKYSAVVSLTNFGPAWSPVPHIFFQRNALYYCPYYLEKIGGWLKVETVLRRRFAVESMKRADLIVTPSHAMGEMIREACPQTRNKRFHTLYHGFAKENLAGPLEEKFAQALTSGKGIKLLFPAHAAAHKGFDVLFQMLARLKSDDVEFCLFTIVARDDWPEGVENFERTVSELGLTDQVIFLGRVPQHQMGQLYALCDLMVYPSLCESFGFSMIEAMGHGLPIVAADTAINREMCGEGALYYSPLDAAAGALTIKEALSSNVLQHLREGGSRRLTSFDWSWKRYAQEFVDMIGLVT